MSGNGSYIDWQAWWACAQARFLRSGGHGSSVPLLRLLNGYTAAAAAIRKPIGAEEKRRFHRSLRPTSTHGERFAWTSVTTRWYFRPNGAPFCPATISCGGTSRQNWPQWACVGISVRTGHLSVPRQFLAAEHQGKTGPSGPALGEFSGTEENAGQLEPGSQSRSKGSRRPTRAYARSGDGHLYNDKQSKPPGGGDNARNRAKEQRGGPRRGCRR